MKHIQLFEDFLNEDIDLGHQDDEPNMLKRHLKEIISYASKLYDQLDELDGSEEEIDFPNWWQEKVILARDYISKAQHYLEFEQDELDGELPTEMQESLVNEDVRNDLKAWIKKHKKDLDKLADQDEWEQIYNMMYTEFNIEPDSQKAKDWKEVFDFVF